MLAGFRSRWTRPRSCACARPAATSAAIRRVSASETAGRRRAVPRASRRQAFEHHERPAFRFAVVVDARRCSDATARRLRAPRARTAAGRRSAPASSPRRGARARGRRRHTALIAPRPSGSSRRYRPATSSSLIGPDYRGRHVRPPDDRRSTRARARAHAAACRTKTSPCGLPRVACSRRRARARSTCRRSPARRWTATPFVRPTRRGLASSASPLPGTRPKRARCRTAIAISTGAVVPDGADAVVPVDGAERRGLGRVEQVAPGENVRPRGGDIEAGESSSRRAAAGPAQLGALAAAGLATSRAHAGRASRCSRPAASFAGQASRSGPARSTSRTP